MTSLISSKFGHIQPCTAELAALDRLKQSFTYLRSIQNILMTCSQVSDRCPLGYLFLYLLKTQIMVTREVVPTSTRYFCFRAEISKKIYTVYTLVIAYLLLYKNLLESKFSLLAYTH